MCVCVCVQTVSKLLQSLKLIKTNSGTPRAPTAGSFFQEQEKTYTPHEKKLLPPHTVFTQASYPQIQSPTSQLLQIISKKEAKNILNENKSLSNEINVFLQKTFSQHAENENDKISLLSKSEEENYLHLKNKQQNENLQQVIGYVSQMVKMAQDKIKELGTTSTEFDTSSRKEEEQLNKIMIGLTDEVTHNQEQQQQMQKDHLVPMTGELTTLKSEYIVLRRAF